MDQPTYSPIPEGGSRHELRGGFDADAEAYDRTRPVCPGAMFDDLVRVAGLSPGDRVVEIGCGTGQATVPLAQRGLAVTAVELGAALADLARSRTASFPGVSVVTGSFEDWQDTGAAPVHAVAVFNALHWIDPDLRYAKPASLLAPGGTLAFGACVSHVLDPCGTRSRMLRSTRLVASSTPSTPPRSSE